MWAIVQEIVALTSLILFVAMIAFWAHIIGF
jgi:hypothetical protein